MSNHQFAIIVLALCCAGVMAGLLPEGGSNGYQYNRPSVGGLDTVRRAGAYDTAGRFLQAGNGFEYGGRPTDTYGAPGFRGFPGGIGYTGRPNVPYPGANAFNALGVYPSGNVPAAGYNSIPNAYRNNYNGDNGRPRPYSFQYEVRDRPSGNDYGQQERSDGNIVQGEYRVVLPDSRTQIVKYTADDVNGYNADVQYEGQAQYPRPGGGYQFNGPEASYQPGFGPSAYQGRGGYNVPGVGGYSTNGNAIFGNTGGVSVGVGPGNQYLPPGGGYGK